MTVSNLLAQISEGRTGFLCDDFKFAAAEFGNEVFDKHGAIFARRKDSVKRRLCAGSIPRIRPNGLNTRMDRYRYRRQWLRKLKDEAGSVAALAEKIGTDPNYLSSLLGPSSKRNIGDDIARRAEDAYKLPRGAMDLPSAGALLIVQEAAGLNEEAIDDILAYIRVRKSSKH